MLGHHAAHADSKQHHKAHVKVGACANVMPGLTRRLGMLQVCQDMRASCSLINSRILQLLTQKFQVPW